MRRLLHRTALSFVLGMSGTAAEAVDYGRLQLHGFASQAVVRTSDNQYFGDSTRTAFDFTELGLNLCYRPDPHLLLSSQVLVRRAGEMYDGTPSVDYALADLTLYSSAERRLGIRGGRYKVPMGLYNETRDIPFTRPGIFLPQVVYYDKIRNLALSLDGLALYGETYGALGNVSLTLATGRAAIDENVEWTYLGNDYPGNLTADGLAWLASLWYSSQTERLKLGFSIASHGMSFEPGANSPLADGSISFIYWIASAQYNARDWTISAEYSRIPLEWGAFGPVYPFSKEEVEGYYLQGAYRLRPDLELMLRYEEGFANRADKDGSRFSALTGGITPASDFYSKIWTAGLRWDILPDLMLRLEYQRHLGTFALSIRENPDPSGLVEEWDAVAASLSVRF